MSDDREVLSALIDREPVDPIVLARVLEDPANRRLLVDFVRVRVAAAAAATDDDEHVAPAWLASPPSVTRPPANRWLRAAAAVLLVAAGAGGGAWAREHLIREGPPEPSRVVQLQPYQTE